MAPLSIVFVTARFPLPLRSGDRARAFHQVQALARRHRVTLVTLLDPSLATTTARQAIERTGVRVVGVPFDRVRSVLRTARALPSSLPLQAALFGAPELADALRTAVRDDRPDLVHLQLARLWPVVDASMDVPLVVDLVDALSLNMRHRAARDRGPLRWLAALDARRLAGYERRICAEADAATVVTDADRAAIGDLPTLSVNPNGVDLEEFPYVPGPRRTESIVFTGNLGYFPNVDAARWFAGEVMPGVWRSRPTARLTIAGARPHARVQALARDPRIVVAGDVPDMHPYLAAARVAVAPMFSGSGQLLKVLEAMATGTPVVATRLGSSGIETVDGREMLRADTADAFVRAVVRVLDDDHLAATLSTGGRALVERLYTWDRSVAQLERLYRAVVDGRAASRIA